MNFLTPELFETARKNIRVVNVSTNEQYCTEYLQNELQCRIQGEVYLQDDVLLNACKLGLPIGYTVRLECDVDFYGDWRFSVDFKLVGCVVAMGSGLQLDYQFEITAVGLAEYYEDKYWDDERQLYSIPRLNDIFELTEIEMAIELLSEKYR